MKKQTILIWGILAILCAFFALFFIKVYYFSFSYKTVDVKKRDMVDEVYAMGKVESSSNAYLYFKNPGKITSINVKVGDSVKTGQVLASQDIKDINSQVSEINAGINLQRARINQLKAGSSKEEISIASNEVANAETSLLNAKNSLKDVKQSGVDSLKMSLTTTDDVVRNKVDQMMTNPRSANPKLVFVTSSDSKLSLEIEAQRVGIEAILKDLNTRLIDISADGDVLANITYTKKQVSTLRQFIEKFSSLVNNPINKPSNVTIDIWSGWRNDIALARTNLNNVYSGLTTAETAINNANSAIKEYEGGLKTAKEQLALKKTGTRSTDLAVYEAQLAQATAERSKIDAQQQDLLILSPFDGLITEVNNKVGELSGPSKNLLTILSSGSMQVKLNVIENNITKVKVGQNVRIAFEAMPDTFYDGKVFSIDPAETEINGSIYYKTIITLNQNEDFLRSGMTANVWITSTSSLNALYVPISALSRNNKKSFVEVLENGKAVTKEVTTGIKDDAGNIEIKSGLQEGEKVIVETTAYGSSF